MTLLTRDLKPCSEEGCWKDRGKCKKELLKSIKEANKERNARLHNIANKVTKFEDGISMIKQFRKVITTQRKRIIGLFYGQGKA